MGVNTRGNASTSQTSGDTSPITSDSNGSNMSWGVPTDMPSTLPLRPNLTTQQSNSLPSTPYQHPRDLPFRSTSRSPRRDSSPRSTHSESNHALPSLRNPYVGCKYETGMAHFRRRMPYSLGSDLLSEESGPLKSTLDPETEEKLCTDMTKLYGSLLPSAESEQRRSRFVGKLENLLNTNWPGNDIKVHIFGSSGNKLCSSDSDVDICITTPFKELEHVCILADFLAKSGMERVVCVSHAKVPIVKIWDPELQLACDMNVNNTTALENTRMIRIYVEIDDRARQLAMAVKHWTKRRILNDAALGGTLSSYTWICLIINFLQTRSPPILPSLQQRAQKKNATATDSPMFDDDLDGLRGFGDENKSSLGSLLFQFFRYYGHELDYEKDVMSVREGKLISKEEKGWHLLQNNRLCVEEPFTTTRNLGNTADDTSFRGVHMELRRAFEAISEGKLDECCEQYEYPPEEERTWERPPPQRRPIIAPVPPLPSRGGRGGGRGGRHSNHFNRGQPMGRRASSAANRQGNNNNNNTRQSNPALTAEIALQAQQAQYLLHDHLYQQIQMLQAQEQELRIQLQNQALMNGRTPPTLVRPYVQFPYPQQENVSSSTATSEETPRARAGTVNHPPLSAPLRQPVFYNSQYLPVSVPATQGTNTNPPSPSIPSATSEVRRSHRRSSVASGSPHSGSLRAQSQPARPLQSPQMVQSLGTTSINVPLQQEGGAQGSSTRNDHTQGSPQRVPVDSESFLSPGVPVMPKSPYVDENLSPEYIGYYVGDDASQLPTGYHSLMATSLPGTTNSFPIHSYGYPKYSRTSPRQSAAPPREQPNSASENPNTQSSNTHPLSRSKTAPDCGPLIIDGSTPSQDLRQSSPGNVHDNSYLSQSAPSSHDRMYGTGTPRAVPDTFPQDYPDQSSYETESRASYDRNQPELRIPAQLNGWDSHLNTGYAGISGHIGRLESLSERLQRFQMSDTTVNSEPYGKPTSSAYQHSQRYALRKDHDVLGSEQSTAKNKPVQPHKSAGIVNESATGTSPSAKRRVNGVADSDKMNGVGSQKAPAKGRRKPSNSPHRVSEHKEKHAEPSSRKPNGVQHGGSGAHAGNVHASTTSGGWQTTKRKHRKGGKAQQQSNGAEPLPTDESLRKGG